MPTNDTTQWLMDWHDGDEEAFERLADRLYDDLRRIAARHLARERRGHTLVPGGLAHECYLGLRAQGRVAWQGRAHFLAVASRTMRRILIMHARRREAAKRGAGEGTVTLTAVDAQALGGARPRAHDLVDLRRALGDLAVRAPRQARLVELRYFGGLTNREAASALGVSSGTAKNDWRAARAWLRARLSSGSGRRPGDPRSTARPDTMPP